MNHVKRLLWLGRAYRKSWWREKARQRQRERRTRRREAHEAVMAQVELQAALDKLAARGIVPTMSADELMRLMRGNDNG